MSTTTITRTTCDRCGHIWEGTEPGQTEIVVRQGEKDIIGGRSFNPYIGHIFGVLCASCSAALIPWLNQPAKDQNA